jgi:hypothetical protein
LRSRCWDSSHCYTAVGSRADEDEFDGVAREIERNSGDSSAAAPRAAAARKAKSR